MNKQIEKLALECGAWHQVYEPNRFLHDHNFDIERFAELIVRECINIAQDRAAFDWAPPNDVNIVIDEIKEHFGVEE